MRPCNSCGVCSLGSTVWVLTGTVSGCDGSWMALDCRVHMSPVYDDMQAVSIQQKLHFEFWSFPGQAIRSTILSHDAGQRQWAAASVQLPWWGKRPLTTTLGPLCHSAFTLGTVFNKSHEVVNILLLKKKLSVRWFCWNNRLTSVFWAHVR